MPIYCRNPLVAARFQQLGGDDLLNRQNYTITAADTDGSAPVLDGLDSILGLKVPAVGGEDGVAEIVTSAYGRLFVAEVSFI
jgi:hypothetical protein